VPQRDGRERLGSGDLWHPAAAVMGRAFWGTSITFGLVASAGSRGFARVRIGAIVNVTSRVAATFRWSSILRGSAVA
jgi:hypothetical protein